MISLPTQTTSALRVLFLVPADLESLVRKGVAHQIEERAEGGRVEYCVTVHPFATRRQEVAVSPTHMLYEYSLGEATGWWPRPARWMRFAGYLLMSAWRVAYLLRKHRINVLRAQDPYYMGAIAWLATCLSGKVNYCVSIHADYDKLFELDGARGAPVVFGSRAVAKAVERFVLHRARRVLPIRESLAAKARQLGIPSERIIVIPHGIDIAAFTVPCDAIAGRRKLKLPEDRKIVSFVGRLSRENYIDDVLSVARILSRRNDAVVVVAGDGAESGHILEALNVDLRLRHALMYLGPLARDDVAMLRRISMAALVPMGGFSLIEACCAGTPVVAYDVEWHHELVISGETGSLVREGDFTAAAAAISQLLDEPNEAARMGANAKRWAIERHSLAVASTAKLSAYRSVLEPM